MHVGRWMLFGGEKFTYQWSRCVQRTSRNSRLLHRKLASEWQDAESSGRNLRQARRLGYYYGPPVPMSTGSLFYGFVQTSELTSRVRECVKTRERFRGQDMTVCQYVDFMRTNNYVSPDSYEMGALRHWLWKLIVECWYGNVQYWGKSLPSRYQNHGHIAQCGAGSNHQSSTVLSSATPPNQQQLTLPYTSQTEVQGSL